MRSTPKQPARSPTEPVRLYDMELDVSNDLILYADDSVIIVYDHNPDIILSKLSQYLYSCNQGLIYNDLTLHGEKTECLLFESRV